LGILLYLVTVHTINTVFPSSLDLILTHPNKQWHTRLCPVLAFLLGPLGLLLWLTEFAIAPIPIPSTAFSGCLEQVINQRV
jgi:hypothetical protein